MSDFSCVIRHIPVAENHWRDLVSRLQSVGGGAADSGEEVPGCIRSIAVVAPTDADYSFPSLSKIRDRQDIYTDGKAVLDLPLGSVMRVENRLYCISYGGIQVIWVPPAERSLQDLFEMTKHQGEYEVQVAWVGLDYEKPAEVMFKDAPILVRKSKQMRLPKRFNNSRRQRYGMKCEEGRMKV